MSFKLERKDGELLRSWRERVPRTNDTCEAELRDHACMSNSCRAIGDDLLICLVVWILDGSEWKIWIAGPECERFMK